MKEDGANGPPCGPAVSMSVGGDTAMAPPPGLQPSAASVASRRMRGLVIVPPWRVSVTDSPLLSKPFKMASAVRLGQAVRMAAIAPATGGVAIEVPASQA